MLCALDYESYVLHLKLTLYGNAPLY